MICGIDEAGRGCLAGPLCVAGVVLHKQIEGIDDSKKLTQKKRENLFHEIIKNSNYIIVFTSASQIDSFGLSFAIKSSIEIIVQNLKADKIIMDGNTSFGVKGVESLIKADSIIKEVGAASILAKVTRDKFMDALDPIFPDYNFISHKGYGTIKHVRAIEKFGYTPLHRKSFKIKSLQPSLF